MLSGMEVNLLKRQIFLNSKKCSVCGDCQAVCPVGVLKLRKLKKRERQNMTLFQKLDCYYHKNKRLEIVDPLQCKGCGMCIKACRRNALSLIEINEPSRPSHL